MAKVGHLVIQGSSRERLGDRPPAVVRPHATPPQSPPRNGTLKRAHSGVPREDDNHSFRGTPVTCSGIHMVIQ
jgi:hypothetical protein